MMPDIKFVPIPAFLDSKDGWIIKTIVTSISEAPKIKDVYGLDRDLNFVFEKDLDTYTGGDVNLAVVLVRPDCIPPTFCGKKIKDVIVDKQTIQVWSYDDSTDAAVEEPAAPEPEPEAKGDDNEE
jgi:hypothetical protein